MQFVTGITLILETGEEIGLHSYDKSKRGILPLQTGENARHPVYVQRI